MGKINKRQRKFLSKKVLPHRKKGGLRRDNKEKKGNKNKTSNTDEGAPATGGDQHRRTLPEGLVTTAFLEVPWITQGVCAATDRDTCVSHFEPSTELLEGGFRVAPTRKGTKRPDASLDTVDFVLTEKAARAIIRHAVDDESIDDLLRAVWALHEAVLARDSAAAATPITTESSSARHTLHSADPESGALSVLRAEALSRLHLAFRAHLGPKREDGASEEEWEDAIRSHRQQLERAEAWPKLGGALLSFLAAALDHMEKMELEVDMAVSRSAAGSAKGNGKNSSSKNNKDNINNAGSRKKQESSENAAATIHAALVDGLTHMRHHVPLLSPFPRLSRRYLAFLLRVLQRTDDTASLSLAFVRLYELSTSQPMPFLHDAFKGSYQSYRVASERIGTGGKMATARAAGVKARTGGGSGSLPLLRECLAELFGVEKPSAYLHAYVYIHDLAREALAAAAEVQKTGLGSRETGSALKRLRSWEFLQSLLLWTSVVASHPAKTSLGPLVPPLTKTLEITFQLSPGLYGAPRTLALARAAQDLAAASGVFLPTSQHLVRLLELLHPPEGRACPTATTATPTPTDGRDAGGEGSSREGRGANDGSVVGGGAGRKRGRGGDGAEAALAKVDLSAVAGLGKEDLRLDEVRAAVSRGASSLIAREAVCYRWSAGLPELCTETRARLRRLLEGSGLPADGGAGRCRARMRALEASLAKTAAETIARRARGTKQPGEAGPVDTFRSMEESTASQRLKVFKETP